MRLRDYQRDAVEAVLRYWELGGENPLIEVPTGGGKSAILGELARVIVQECGGRVVIATHRAELIQQDAAACRAVWPEAPIAVWSASLGKRQTAAITVCGVQSVARKTEALGVVDVLIVDEAHLIPPDGDGQYQQLVRGLRARNPALRIVGLTATPYRLRQGYLTQGAGALFSSIVYRCSIPELIAGGYLSRLVTGSPTAQINLDEVAIRAGEFAAADLEMAADIAEITDRVADDVVLALASGRTSALVFGCSVVHAQHLADAVIARGRSCAVITGETDQMVRANRIAEFRARKLDAIASCDVLTTGFDAPVVDVLALVRATASASLYVQMVGRGMRVADGKADCLVLDYGGNIARHGPVDEVRIKERQSNGNGAAPIKICPNCAASQPAGVRVCFECDTEFPLPERAANEQASSLPILSTGAIGGGDNSGRHEVGHCEFHVHRKRMGGGPPTARIDYYAPSIGNDALPTKIASEWVCVEHDGYAHEKARQWWAQHIGTAMPATVADAVERLQAGEMRRVIAISTKRDKEFTKVTRIEQAPMREPGSDDVTKEELADAPAADPWDGDDLPF